MASVSHGDSSVKRQESIYSLLHQEHNTTLILLYGIDDNGLCTCGGSDTCKPGKHPNIARLVDFELDRWLARDVECNIGVLVEQSGLIIVAPDSLEWLAKFKERDLPETYTVQSGGGAGHQHFYYRVPYGTDISRYRNVNKSGEYDLMVRGYVVGPGSRHPSGNLYQMVQDAPIIDCPPWVLLEFEKSKQEHEAAEDYLKRFYTEPPVPLTGKLREYWDGKFGDNKDRSGIIYGVIAGCHKAGANPAMLRASIPQWATRVGINKFAAHHDPEQAWDAEIARVCQKIDKEGPTSFKIDPDTSPFTRSSDLAKKEPPTNLVQGFLPEKGVAVFYGDDGTYKSFLLMHLGMRIAEGERFFGRKLKKGPVYYLAAEAQGSYTKRTRGWFKKYGDRDPDLFFLDGIMPNASDDAWMHQFAAAVKESKPRLIVFDTYSKSTSGEEGTKDVGDVMNRVIDISNELECLFIFIHHTGKDGEDPRGSSKFGRDTDAVYLVEKTTKLQGKVTCKKPKDFEAPEPFGFTLEVMDLAEDDEFGDSLTTLVITEPDDPEALARKRSEFKPMKGDKEILLALMQSQREMMLWEIRDAISGIITIAQSSVENCVKRLEDAGYITTRKGEGNGKDGKKREVLWVKHIATGTEDQPFGTPNKEEE